MKKNKYGRRDMNKILFEYGEKINEQKEGYSLDCIEDEKLADYYCGFLSKEEKTSTEKHLSECALCLERVVDMHRSITSAMKSKETADISVRTEERIKNIIPGKDISDAETELFAENKIECIKCGTRTSPAHNYCFNCGDYIANALACHHCDAAIGEGDSFCRKCGKKITADKKNINEYLEKVRDFFPDKVKDNSWLMAAVISVILSLGFSAFFLQFLLLGGIFAGKWIFKPALMKEVVKIHVLWKSGKEEEAEKERDRLKKMLEGVKD